MRISKRPAKRIAPKTLAKMRERTAAQKQMLEATKAAEKSEAVSTEITNKNISKKIDSKTADASKKAKITVAKPTKKRPAKRSSRPKKSITYDPNWTFSLNSSTLIKDAQFVNAEILDALQKRKEQIFSQKKILSQKLSSNALTKREYKDLFKRNALALEAIEKKIDRANFLYSINNQNAMLSKVKEPNIIDAHKRTVDFLVTRYNKGKIKTGNMKNVMDVLNFTFESAINQHNILASKGNLVNVSDHSKIISNALSNFIKKRKLSDLKEQMSVMNTLITKNETSFSKTLQEINKAYR